MFGIGDRVVVVKSCKPVLRGYVGTVVDDDPAKYPGCVTVEFDSPMPFKDTNTGSDRLRHMSFSLLRIVDKAAPIVDIDIKFSFDSLIGEQHE